MENLAMVLLPLVVTGLTSLTKRIPVISGLSDGARLAAIRFITALFAFLGASAVYAAGGDPVASTSVNELVMTFYVFLGAIGGHMLLKNK